MVDDYPTISLDSGQVDLAIKKAEELVDHFMPKIVERNKTGSTIPEQTVQERVRRLYYD